MKVCRFLVAGLNTKQNRMLLHLQRWRAVRKVGVCLFVCAASMEAIFSIAVHHVLAKCSSFCIMSVSLASINCAKKAGIDLLIIISLRVAGSHVSSPKSKSLEVNLCNLYHWENGSWDLLCYTWFQVLSFMYDMNDYMTTFFGGEAWDLCWELGQAKKLTPTFDKSPHNMFLLKITKIRLSWWLTMFLWFSWCSKVETSPPCESALLACGSPVLDPCYYTYLGPPHTRGKSSDHEIVRAQKKCPKASQDTSKIM